MPGSLSVRDVSKSFAAVQVLDHVSLVVAPGRPQSGSSARTGSASRPCSACSPG